MKPLKQSVSVTLDQDIIEPLKELAAIQDRSFSSCINLILKHWFAEYHKNPKTTYINKDF